MQYGLYCKLFSIGLIFRVQFYQMTSFHKVLHSHNFHLQEMQAIREEKQEGLTDIMSGNLVVKFKVKVQTK